MAGRKPIYDGEIVRENQIVIPMSFKEKELVKEAAKKNDRSMASFVRMVLNEYFARKAE